MAKAWSRFAPIDERQCPALRFRYLIGDSQRNPDVEVSEQ
jgi:hypothetical protein